MADLQRKTANLYIDKIGNAIINSGGIILSRATDNYNLYIAPVIAGETYSLDDSLYYGFFASYPNVGDTTYNGSREKAEKFIAPINGYVAVRYDISITTPMINEGSTALPYEPYGWVHSFRKLTTATDTFTTLPVDIYADGNNATVGLKGNTVQNGTPTPDNPIMPQGTGERTENLFDGNYVNAYLTPEGIYAYPDKTTKSIIVKCNPNTTYTIKQIANVNNSHKWRIAVFNSMPNNNAQGTMLVSDDSLSESTITTLNDSAYIVVYYVYTASPYNVEFMINLGSTPLPYENFGYKIPISSANTTTPVYLGEVETTRQIGKIDLSEVSWTMLASGLWRTTDIPNIKYVSANTELGGGIAEKYTIHTGAGMISALNCIAIDVSQVSVNTGSNTETPTGMFWYVLAESETGIVNEPLMRIGDYADTVSDITIPTITGKDTFDVETTLKPSEVTISYTGWHNATVEEWDGSQWNE